MANEIKEINDLISSADGEGGCIPNGRLAPIMRCTIENKALLSAKGALYVGTGATNQKVVNYGEGSSETWEIPKTEALNPPMTADETPQIANDYILTTTSEPGYNGLKWVQPPQRYYFSFSEDDGGWQENFGPEPTVGKFCIATPALPVEPAFVTVQVWRRHAPLMGSSVYHELVSAPVYFVKKYTGVGSYDNKVFVYSNSKFAGFALITVWSNFCTNLTSQ